MTTKRPLSQSGPARELTLPVTGSRPLSPVRAIAHEAALVLAGTAALALVGQLALPLPFTPVPVTLGTFAALGVGTALGSRRGVASAVLLAVLAAGGAPVLAGWTGGVTASFGYVLGYALAAGLAGRAAQVWSGARGGAASSAPSTFRHLLVTTGVMLVASAAVYVPGLLWLKAATGASWTATLGMGLAPFVVGDLLKTLAAAGLTPLLSRIAAR